MHPATPFLLAVAMVGFLAHLPLSARQPPGLLRAGVKALCVGAMAAIAAVEGGPALLVLALALGALGDALLEGPGERFILPGMAAFALGHGAYIALFLDHASAPMNWPLAGFSLLAALSMIAFLGRSPGPLRLPVAAYALIIAVKAALATRLEGAAALALPGAFLFILSDTVLALNLFRLPANSPWRRLTAPVVWLTYVGAQALILLAFLPHLRPGS